MNRKMTTASKTEYSTKTHPSHSTDKLLNDTMKFFLENIATELSQEIDWRARGHDKNIIIKTGIYMAAVLRDLMRIPLHNQRGIGQAQFRFRVAYISKTAIPTLSFFLKKYPIEKDQRNLIEEAITLLQKGAELIKDGRIPTLDEWYATMEEFYKLTQYSQKAAKKIEKIINFI